MSKSILFYFKKPQTNQIMFSHFEELAPKNTFVSEHSNSQDPVKCYSLRGREFRIHSTGEGWICEELSVIWFIK